MYGHTPRSSQIFLALKVQNDESAWLKGKEEKFYKDKKVNKG